MTATARQYQIIFLNGQLVPESEARVSVFDRGFLYGDGLFETLRVENGVPFRWAQHWNRFQRGAEYLRLRVPFSEGCLREFLAKLIDANRKPQCMLRITLSRGVGLRGCSPKGANQPTLVMSLHDAPKTDPEIITRWKLIHSSVPLAVCEPLAQFKTSNKLAQVLARAEADDAGADEALLSNGEGWVVEGAGSNLFWIRNEQVCTPPLGSGILAGVTRAVVIELCERAGLATCETHITPKNLLEAEGVFLSVSSVGVVEAASLDSQPLPRSPLTKSLYEQYTALVDFEIRQS